MPWARSGSLHSFPVPFAESGYCAASKTPRHNHSVPECAESLLFLFYEEVYHEKSAVPVEEQEDIISDSEEFIIEKQSNNYNLRLRYKRVEPRGTD